MKFNKDHTYSKNSYFWIPTYYDNENDIYFCEPESKEFVSKFYEKEYWDSFSRKKKKKFFTKLLNIIYKIFNSHDIKYLYDFQIISKYKKLNSKIKILEIWVWLWKNIKYFFRKWYNISWLEIDKQSIKNINSTLKKEIVIEWNYEEVNIEKKYDLIYLRHVFEHFLDINLVTKKFKNNLNKNWIIYINIPNNKNSYILNESIYNHPHIYHFSEKSLKNIFELNWYKTLHLWSYDIINKNKYLYLLKNIFWLWKYKFNKEWKWEFLIWVFNK